MNAVLTRCIVIILSLTFLAACSTWTRIPLDESDVEARRYAQSGNIKQEVDSIVQPLIDNGVTPGMVVGVLLPDGSQQFFSYGVRNKNNGAPPDADTQFAIGSLSKGFLGALTSVLVQEGVISWDDTIEKLLPADTELSPDARRITLAQLATHTSGLPRQPMTMQTLAYFIEYLFTGESFYRHFDLPYVMNYLKTFDAPTELTPQYSNIGYGLLGHILEHQTGKSLDALLAEKILTPLDLHATGYEPQALPGYDVRARGYAGDHPKFIRRGQPVPDWEFTEFMKGSANVHSTARDLLQFAAAHLKQSDDPLTQALKSTLTIRYPREREAAAIAWGVDNIYGQKITYQVGLVAGYTGYIGLDTEQRSAIVVLQNAFNWSATVGHRILQRISKAAELKKAAESDVAQCAVSPCH